MIEGAFLQDVDDFRNELTVECPGNNLSSLSRVVQCCLTSGKWDSKINLYGPCISSDYELESTFRGVVDIYLVECPFLVHYDFGIMREEVWNDL